LFFSSSQVSQHYYTSVYRVCSASICNVFIQICCIVLYKGEGFQCNVCVCYSWELALNVMLDVSFLVCSSGKGTRVTETEANSFKAVTRISAEFSMELITLSPYLVPYEAVDRNKVLILQLVFIFLLSHYMFRPLRAIFR
jgi:hypothetical protein